MTTLTDKQRTDKNNVELTIRDVSKVDKKTVLTTDETLFEIATIKQRINQQLLKSIKESAIDCEMYKSGNKDENLVCYGFGKVESNMFASYPNLNDDLINQDENQVKELGWTPLEVTINNIKYALNENTMELYDYESYEDHLKNNGELNLIGKLVKKNNAYRIAKMIE